MTGRGSKKSVGSQVRWRVNPALGVNVNVRLISMVLDCVLTLSLIKRIGIPVPMYSWLILMPSLVAGSLFTASSLSNVFHDIGALPTSLYLSVTRWFIGHWISHSW